MKSGIFTTKLNTLLESGKLNLWSDFFKAEREKEYFSSLEDFLNREYQSEKIFPKAENIFNAFTSCDLHGIKVAILGQDPYHEENQAMGLAFSVPSETKIPPSLRNIFAEMKSDIGVIRTNGDISDLAKKGVFLLNTVLTVRKGTANSHAKMGWERFTSEAISHVCRENPHLVLMLFGKPAEKFEKLATCTNHIIKTSHPSPLSAYRGFLGSKIFSQADEILEKYGEKIDWQEQNTK